MSWKMIVLISGASLLGFTLVVLETLLIAALWLNRFSLSVETTVGNWGFCWDMTGIKELFGL